MQTKEKKGGRDGWGRWKKKEGKNPKDRKHHNDTRGLTRDGPNGGG